MNFKNDSIQVIFLQKNNCYKNTLNKNILEVTIKHNLFIMKFLKILSESLTIFEKN